MIRSVPQFVSAAAVVVGAALFGVTLFRIDLRETLESAGRLGLALPLILLPGVLWQLLRAWGWSVSFPDESRPSFTRLVRVRLASDAVGFFTVRGVVGEPLKVVLLYDRVAPEVTAAAVTFERLAFAVIPMAMAGLVSLAVLTRLDLPGAWNAVFASLSLVAVGGIVLVVMLTRRRTGDYLGRLVASIDRVTGRQFEASRVIRFLLGVEDVLLELLRGSRRRLVILSVLPVVCYLLMAIEVGLVFWAIGEPVTLTELLAVETFARLASIASAGIPANLGALEASHVAVTSALGLGGGGALALVRRTKSLLWAAIGLALYPARVARPSRSTAHD